LNTQIFFENFLMLNICFYLSFCGQ